MYKPSLTQRPILAFEKGPITKALYSKYVKSERKPADSWEEKQITVTIVAYNERELLIQLLDKLMSINDPRAGIVLVDNGLDEDIKNAVKDLPIYYIEATTNLGCTGGRNLAASRVSTTLMTFLDADGSIDDSYIEECFSAMSSPSTICARGKVLPLTSESRTPPSYNLGESSFPYYPSAEGISVWRTADYKKAGGFEEDLYGGEGVVLCYRMVNLMDYEVGQFIYYPQLILHHDYNNDTSHLKSKEIRNYINRWSIDRRYPLLDSLIQDYNETSRPLRPILSGENSHVVNSIVRSAKKQFKADVQSLVDNRARHRWNHRDVVEKDQKYKFSVILPCYNLGSMLEDAVRSILRQTLDNIEVIVVDDVSPDENTKAVLKYLESHITVIYRPQNGGASAARNTGIKVANAEYILCLDADDMIEPTYLEEAYNLFEMDSRIGIVAPYTKITGVRNGSWKPKDNTGLIDALVSSPIPNASCFRKQAWEESGGYDETMRGYEDWEYWISILEKKWTIRVIPRLHYIYVTRAGSKVKTSNKNAADIVAHIVTKHEKVFRDNMTYVIAHIYKRYVDARLQVSSAATPEDLRPNFFTRNTRRFTRKTKTAMQVTFIDKDFQSLPRLVKMNLQRASKALRHIVRR